MAISDNDQLFENILREAKEGQTQNHSQNTGVTPLQSDDQLKDNFHAEERKIRNQSITSILHCYKEEYQNKTAFQKWCRYVLFWGCSAIVVLFSIAVIVLVGFTVVNSSKLDLAGVAAIVTAALSLVFAIIKLMEIITKYCFPENDNEYIVQIVKAIQENDLASVKEANRIAEMMNNIPSKKVHSTKKTRLHINPHSKRK